MSTLAASNNHGAYFAWFSVNGKQIKKYLKNFGQRPFQEVFGRFAGGMPGLTHNDAPRNSIRQSSSALRGR
jgi:hypothetical protein